jgi:hypothetical protein
MLFASYCLPLSEHVALLASAETLAEPPTWINWLEGQKLAMPSSGDNFKWCAWSQRGVRIEVIVRCSSTICRNVAKSHHSRSTAQASAAQAATQLDDKRSASLTLPLAIRETSAVGVAVAPVSSAADKLSTALLA